MPSVSDHIRRDAEHAARSDIRVLILKYVRRMDEQAKAHIAEAIANAEPGAELDGTRIGRDAASKAIAALIAPEPFEALEGTAAPAAQLDA